MTSPSLFNHDRINAAFRQQPLTVAQFAYRMDMSIQAMSRLLSGAKDPGELRVQSLVRIADALGIPVTALFAAPADQPADATPSQDLDADPEPGSPAAVADDAHRVIAAIYDRGSTPTLNRDLAAALGWSLDRLTAAYREADQRLRISGLRLYRQHGEAVIRPLHDRETDRQNLTNRLASEYAMKSTSYKAVYQVLHDQPVTVLANASRRQLVLGELANLNVLDLTGDRPALTSDAAYANPTP